MWRNAILLLALTWGLQVYLSIRQTNHYRQNLRELSAGYTGYLGVGVARRKLGAGAVAILRADSSGMIMAGRLMTGMSVFARFRPFEEVVGVHVRQLQEGWEAKKGAVTQAVRQAAGNILTQMERVREEEGRLTPGGENAEAHAGV